MHGCWHPKHESYFTSTPLNAMNRFGTAMFNQHQNLSKPTPAPEATMQGLAGENAHHDEAPLISVNQIFAILCAHWFLAAVVFITVILSTLAYIAFAEKTYSATVTFIANFNSMDPLAAREMAESAQSSFLPTQMELLQSDTVLDAAIDRLGLTKVPEFSRGHNGDEGTLRNWVEAKLRKNLEIEPGRSGSQLIYLNASATTPELAADIANAVADAYLAQHFSDTAGPSNERATRYAEQLSTLKNNVEAAQQAYTAVRAQSGFLDSDAKGDVDMDVLNALEHKLLEARNKLRSNQATATVKTDPTTSVLTSNTVTNLRQEGARLATRMAQLRSELGPNHPNVLSLQSEMEANQASLTAALTTYSNANSSDLSVSSQEVASLERAVAAQRVRVQQGKLAREQAAKYQIELQSAQNVYKQALDGYDKERFAASAQNTNIRLASRARLPVKADKPKPLKYLLLGSAAALLLAFCGPFAVELPRRRIQCQDDLERDFGVPVLVVLPPIAKRRLFFSKYARKHATA